MPPRARSTHQRPRTRYRNGDRDTDARREHAEQSTAWRRELARAALDPVAPVLVAALAAGVPLRQACETVRVSTVAVHGRRQWDPQWAAMIDAALMKGRDPGIDHGTEHGYKRCLVRCPECRDAHNRTRGARSRAGARPQRLPDLWQ